MFNKMNMAISNLSTTKISKTCTYPILKTKYTSYIIFSPATVAIIMHLGELSINGQSLRGLVGVLMIKSGSQTD